MAATDKHATTEELLEAVFSVRSVPRLYTGGQLPLEESELSSITCYMCEMYREDVTLRTITKEFSWKNNLWSRVSRGQTQRRIGLR
jgi:hypothetical protein